MSHCLPRCLHVVCELGIPDALDDSPRTAAELAAATGTNADALNRALRLLAAHGVFEPRNGAWAHSELSRMLRTDHPQSMRSLVRMIGMDFFWRAFGSLEHTLRTGKPGTETFLPNGMWGYLADNPEASRIFDEAMTGKAHGQIAGILNSYDFSPFRTIADIGGGVGHLLNAVLKSTPNVKGILFDQPHVVARAAPSDRLAVQGGDFFKDALPVADAYTIMQVIHDWSDEESVSILSAIRRSAPAGAKLLLIEAILPESPAPTWINLLDLHMMAALTGRERTQSEFRTMLRTAGFQLDRVIDIGLKTSILESVAV